MVLCNGALWRTDQKLGEHPALVDFARLVIRHGSAAAERQGDEPLHFFAGLAVLAAALNEAAVGAPAVPGLRMRSPLPSAIRSRFAAMFA